MQKNRIIHLARNSVPLLFQISKKFCTLNVSPSNKLCTLLVSPLKKLCTLDVPPSKKLCALIVSLVCKKVCTLNKGSKRVKHSINFRTFSLNNQPLIQLFSGAQKAKT